MTTDDLARLGVVAMDPKRANLLVVTLGAAWASATPEQLDDLSTRTDAWAREKGLIGALVVPPSASAEVVEVAVSDLEEIVRRVLDAREHHEP